MELIEVSKLKRLLNSMDDRDIVTINVLDGRTGKNLAIHNPSINTCLGVSLEGSWEQDLVISVYLGGQESNS